MPMAVAPFRPGMGVKPQRRTLRQRDICGIATVGASAGMKRLKPQVVRLLKDSHPRVCPKVADRDDRKDET